MLSLHPLLNTHTSLFQFSILAYSQSIMFANIFATLFTVASLAHLGAASPIKPTITNAEVVARNLDNRALASVLVYAKSNFLGLDACLNVQVGPQSNYAALVQAQANLALGGIAQVQVCLTVIGNAVPTCSSGGLLSAGGCGFECAQGFKKNSAGDACIPENPTPSTLPRRRRLAKSVELCAFVSETACPLSGSLALTKNDIDSHNYTCQDLSSSLESCGACGNVCAGSDVGCFEGNCIILA